MKLAGQIIISFFTILGAITCAQAQSPREQLTQMVEQLKMTPTDATLREKIIRLAQDVKPAPLVPEEAQRREGRGKFAFKTAKSNDDYLAAAREYEEAVRVAPWLPGYYADLCTIYEKAEKYAEAKRQCEFSLVGLSGPLQVSEIKQRIAGLEYGIETANSPPTREARRRSDEQRFLDSLDGAIYVCDEGKRDERRQVKVWYEFKGGKLQSWEHYLWASRDGGFSHLPLTPMRIGEPMLIAGKVTRFESSKIRLASTVTVEPNKPFSTKRALGLDSKWCAKGGEAPHTCGRFFKRDRLYDS